jgi:hypothetical protein
VEAAAHTYRQTPVRLYFVATSGGVHKVSPAQLARA